MKRIITELRQIKFTNPAVLLHLFFWIALRSQQLNNNITRTIYIDLPENEFKKKIQELSSHIPKGLFVTNEKSKEDRTEIVFEFKFFYVLLKLLRRKSIRVLDPNFFYTAEASTRFRLFYYDGLTEKERDNYIQQAKKNLISYKKNYNEDPCWVVGTGPSFDDAEKLIPDGGQVITCNSAIYSDYLWENKDVAIAFGDPVYHFGLSKEALRFKESIQNRFSKKPFYIICPIEAMPLINSNWGVPIDYIIGLPMRKDSLPSLLSENNFVASRTSNVLTEFMLPVATFLSKTIYLGGFDGRNIGEKLFWQYSSTTVQDVKAHQEVHTTFFEQRNIDEYYKTHLQTLDKHLIYYEKNKIKFINKTPSLIPSLKNRT